MALSVDGCRLCLCVASSLDAPVVLCDSVPSFAARPKTDDDDAYQKFITVAEVLKKHFWFEIHGDREVNAFVCQPCWIKVVDFHQFYQTVLVLYQHNVLAIDQKFEVILKEDNNAAQSKSCVPSNCSDDDEGVDHNVWYVDSFCVDVKQEEQDNDNDEVTSEPLPTPPPKRLRGRPPNVRAIDPINVENPASGRLHRDLNTTSDLVDDPDDPHHMLATYFTLRCDLCDEPLLNLTMARNHHRQVHKQRGYLCCGCGQRFVRNASILEHCAFHADPSPHKCTECCKIFTNAGRLASHQHCKHPTTGSASAEEGMTANTSSATKSPTSCPRPDDELMRRYMSMVCTLCDGDERSTSYESFRKLRQHQRKVHGDNGYLECCGKRFVKKCHAIEHCKWHENPQLFDCNICGRSFANSVNLRDHHIRRHSSSAPFSHQCDQCDNNFQLIVQLRYHKRRAHMVEDDHKFECFSCHRRFVFQSQLRLHLRSGHDQPATFMCDVCAKNFKSKHTYELHYAVEHCNVAKCQCPECGKWLKHAGRLSRHMAQHRSVPSKCEQCDHVAPNVRALYMHRRRVHCEPTHKCLVCGKMFKRPQPLREHMAMHAGITDLYTCAYCPQTFRSHANMYKHRRQVHAEQFEVDRQAAKLAEDERNAEEAAAAVANPQGRMRF